MALDLNDPEVKAALEAAVEEAVAGLKKKNAELLRKIESSKDSIKPEDHERALKERDDALAKLEAAGKKAKDMEAANATLSESLKGEQSALERILVDDGLTNALVKAGVRPEFLDASKALLRAGVKVVKEGDERKVLVGDKPIAESVTAWVGSDAGKHFVAAPANAGGGAGGGAGGSKAPATRPERKNYGDEAAYFRDLVKYEDSQQAA
jgi:hypothetical protein